MPTNTTYWQQATAPAPATKTNISSYKTEVVTAGSADFAELGNCVTITGSITFGALNSNDVLFDLSSFIDYPITLDYYFIGFNSSGSIFRFIMGSDKKIKSYGANSAGSYVAFMVTFAH